MKRFAALLLALLLTAGLAGCNKEKDPDVIMAAETVVTPLVETADPDAALEKIYENVTIEEVEKANGRVLDSKFHIDPSYLDEYFVRYASGRYGVADVFILKPAPEFSAQVRQALEDVKDMRQMEFEDYDIYNARQIAEDAPIFEQGGYLIMLMLDDQESARAVIDQYIPKIQNNE